MHFTIRETLSPRFVGTAIMSMAVGALLATGSYAAYEILSAPTVVPGQVIQSRGHQIDLVLFGFLVFGGVTGLLIAPVIYYLTTPRNSN
jgi:hypothetical protein